MTKREEVIKGLTFCTTINKVNPIETCGKCPYFTKDSEPDVGCIDILELDALELLKKREAVKPNRGLLDNYYCGMCGSMITASIKIFDGEKYMIEHPDHLKPEHKWKYCKNCGRAVKWDG